MRASKVGPAQRGDAGGARADDFEISPGNNADDLIRQRLELFAVRCRQMAGRVNAGAVHFVWAIDVLYEASIWSGLSDDVGDDAVQQIMARAFMGVRR